MFPLNPYRKKTAMKKIRKLLPLFIYDIPGVECWLEEQVNSGLFRGYLEE